MDRGSMDLDAAGAWIAVAGAELQATGRLRRAAIPAVPEVRQADRADLDFTVEIVSATDDRTARALLWAALGESGDEVAIQVLRADQQWAIDVAVRASLDLMPTGPLCRMDDTGPMTPYLPHTGVL